MRDALHEVEVWATGVEGILLEPFLFLLGICHAARRSSALMTLNFPRVHSVISAVLLPACGKLSDNTSCISTANEKHVTHLRKVAFECFRRHPGQRTSSTSCRLCRFDCFHGHCHPKVSLTSLLPSLQPCRGPLRSARRWRP